MDKNGIITALVTPLNKENEICDDCLKQLIEFQVNKGINGLFLAGTYGEGIILPKNEKLKLFEKALEYKTERVYLLPHVGAGSIDTIVELGKKAVDLGYDEVSVIAPLYYRSTKEGLISFYEYIASKIDSKILIYNNPGRQGYNITPDDFEVISDKVKSIIGIKDSSKNPEQLLEYVKRFGNKYFIAGAGDSLILYTFLIGAKAHICGVSNLVPELAKALYEKVINKDFAKAIDLQYNVDVLRKILMRLSTELQVAIKIMLKYRGINAGYSSIQLRQEPDLKIVEEAKKILENIIKLA